MGIQTLHWELPSYLDLNCSVISGFPTSRETLPNFGDVGIFHYHPGLEITFIYPWEDQKTGS